MAREISRAEAWERAHEIFTQVNFNSFDYNTIKESLLDYVKLYFPEDYNSFIESAEFIAILELFAYIGELLAYRVDLNAHENFISTAQRKESILRLAKLISYKASRNLPARGLVKLTSVQTTENIVDSQGRNLAGRRVYWNDSNNPDWKEQFLLILNRILEQEFGSVAPNERIQVDDVLFELYTFNNNPVNQGGKSVLSYSANASGTTAPMELVPLELTDSGPIERRPEINGKFSLVYANDGLGDGSDTTGFMMYTKQGTLQQLILNFDGVTPNQTYNIDVENINETDVWINNVDPNTGQILVNDPYAKVLPHLVSDDLKYGEWIEVDLANAQNIIFNTNRNRHKYEVETLDNDKIRLIFGDGEFSDIPSGTFHVWFRTSLNQDIIIEKNSVVNQTAALTYNDTLGNVQTFTFTFSLVNSLQNASSSEDIEHIRRTAPSVYYTQDRMVNGRDYNTFMLQDPSILKLRSINRTFAGDSKYIAWHDPREYYEDVKLFGDDLALYWIENTPDKGGLLNVPISNSAEAILDNVLTPLLSSADFFAKLGPELEKHGLPAGGLRQYFKTAPYSFDPLTNEREAIVTALNQAISNSSAVVDLYYSVPYDEWTVNSHPCDVPVGGCTNGAADSIWMIQVIADVNQWVIVWRTRRLIAHSVTTKFWNSNTTEKVVNFSTLNSKFDNIVVLQANMNANAQQPLMKNQNFNVLAMELVDQNLPNQGLPDINRLSVLPVDVTDDGIPDNLSQNDIMVAVIEGTWPADVNNPTRNDIATLTDNFGFPCVKLSTYLKRLNVNSINIMDDDFQFKYQYEDPNNPGVIITKTLSFADGELAISGDDQTLNILDKVAIVASIPPVGAKVTITMPEYVYFERETPYDPWVPVEDTDTNRLKYLIENTTEDQRLYTRRHGRYPLNFAWLHSSPRLNLIDPAASNIIDIFVITKGYYIGLLQWLEDKIDVRPNEPTPMELRNTYSDMLDNRMISDTVILHSGKFKILFGSKSIPQLQAKFKVVRPEQSSMTDNQVKVEIVNIIRSFFNINDWSFGETFYFTELAAAIHAKLGPEIDSVVLVPTFAEHQFGDLFQVQAREDEMFIPDVSTNDIEIIQTMTPTLIRQ